MTSKKKRTLLQFFLIIPLHLVCSFIVRFLQCRSTGEGEQERKRGHRNRCYQIKEDQLRRDTSHHHSSTLLGDTYISPCSTLSPLPNVGKGEMCSLCIGHSPNPLLPCVRSCTDLCLMQRHRSSWVLMWGSAEVQKLGNPWHLVPPWGDLCWPMPPHEVWAIMGPGKKHRWWKAGAKGA